VALHGWRDEAAMRRLAAEQSRTTHAAPQAVEACELFALLLRQAILVRLPAYRTPAPAVRTRPRWRGSGLRRWWS